MKLKDIKTGMRVVINNLVFIALPDYKQHGENGIFVNLQGFMRFDDYDDDLCYPRNPSFPRKPSRDISSVHDSDEKNCRVLSEYESGKCLWSRAKEQMEKENAKK